MLPELPLHLDGYAEVDQKSIVNTHRRKIVDKLNIVLLGRFPNGFQ